MIPNTDGDPMIDLINRRISRNGECLEWTGYIDHKNLPRVRGLCVHRYIWEKNNPKVPKTESVVRSCQNRACINIDHLQCVKKRAPIVWPEVWERMLRQTTRAENGCLIWTAGKDKGYGRCSLKGRCVPAHRLAWMVKNETTDIPATIDGKQTNVRHKCREKACVEPSHLELCTLEQNHFPDNPARGEKHHAAKITADLASQIKLSKRKRGDVDYVTQKSRAALFGVAQHTVASIDCGLAWAHIPDRYGNIKPSRAKCLSNKKAKTRVWTADQLDEAAKKLYSRVKKTTDKNRGHIEGDCWEFEGSTLNEYGIISVFGKAIRAHVLACEIKYGRHKRKGEVCRHLCGNKLCIAAEHLAFGTVQENAADMLTHGSRAFKMSYSKAQEIRGRRSSNSPPTKGELAAEYGVSVQTITSIEQNRSWKQVSQSS